MAPIPPSINPMRRTYVSFTRRSKRLVALAVGLSLVAAACGDDDDADTADTPTDEDRRHRTRRPHRKRRRTGGDDRSTGRRPKHRTGTDAPAGDVAMTVTFDINPDAVWEDGTPITWEDFECTWQAQLNTPGSIETAGYDAVSGVAAGENDQQVVISFNRVYAPYKTHLRRDHQEGRRRRLHGHLDRLPDGASDLGPAVHDQLVRRERARARAEPELVGRPAASPSAS